MASVDWPLFVQLENAKLSETIAAVKALAQRFAVARMLDQGLTYDEIAARTGASSATISRVRRFLTYGADGYTLVLKRLGNTAPGEGRRRARRR